MLDSVPPILLPINDDDSFFTIKQSICLHNHECNDNNYIQTKKKSGKYTKDVVDHVIPILAPYIRNGEKPTTSFVRDLISPLLPQRFAIDAQFVCNIMALAKNKMKSEHFEDPRPLVLDSESIDSLPGLDKASASARATLDEVQRTCNDTSWDVYVYMKKLQSNDDGFKYEFMTNEKEQVIGVTWQTTSMRSALMKYGEIVNFDFRKARSNNLNWAYGCFVVLNGNNQFFPASESFFVTEDLASYEFMINTTMAFTPLLNPNSIKLGYSDGFLNQEAVRKRSVLKNLVLLLDPYHLATCKEGRSIWSIDFGKGTWSLLGSSMIDALYAETEEDFNVSLYDKFVALYLDSLVLKEIANLLVQFISNYRNTFKMHMT